jgi:hypothetical protein
MTNRIKRPSLEAKRAITKRFEKINDTSAAT